MKKIKKQTLVSLLFAGVVLIATAATAVIRPELKIITLRSYAKGSFEVIFDHKNTKKISFYERTRKQLKRIIDVDLEEKDTWKRDSFLISNFPKGLHTFQLEATNSNNEKFVKDSIQIYINTFENQ